MRYHEHEISCDLAGYDLYLGGPVLRGPVHLTKQQFTGEQMISDTAAAFNCNADAGWHYFYLSDIWLDSSLLTNSDKIEIALPNKGAFQKIGQS